MVFDSLPQHSSDLVPVLFEERLSQAKRRIEKIQHNLRNKNNEISLNVEIVHKEKCTGYPHLYSKLSNILEKVSFVILCILE